MAVCKANDLLPVLSLPPQTLTHDQGHRSSKSNLKRIIHQCLIYKIMPKYSKDVSEKWKVLKMQCNMIILFDQIRTSLHQKLHHHQPLLNKIILLSKQGHKASTSEMNPAKPHIIYLEVLFKFTANLLIAAVFVSV